MSDLQSQASWFLLGRAGNSDQWISFGFGFWEILGCAAYIAYTKILQFIQNKYVCS